MQQTNQSQELWEQRPNGTQDLHRIPNVRSDADVQAPPSCDIFFRVMDTVLSILRAYALYW